MHHPPTITLEELEYDDTCLLPKKESGASPVHSEASNRQARARLPTEEPLVFLSHGPSNYTDVSEPSGHCAVYEGACKATLHYRHLAPLDPSSTSFPSYWHALFGRATHYDFRGLGSPKRRLGPVSNFFPEQRSRSFQAPLTGVSPDPPPCPTVDRTLNSDDSDHEGYISSTLTSLESLKRKTNLLRIALWVVGSDFFRLQFPEPIVGDALMRYPSIIDVYGLKGQSIYTAFFDHLDMETFHCWECGHTIEEDLEAAIVHQRTMHFRHEPYRCHGLDGLCRRRFASQRILHAHQSFAGH